MSQGCHRPPSRPSALWFRNDLRLADHAALIAAVETGRPVLPAFVLDQTSPGRWSPGGASLWWLHHSLNALASSLCGYRAPLVLRRGPVIEQIVRLVDEAGAGDVFAGCPAEPWASRIDEMLAGVLRARQVGFRRFRTRTLFSPDVLRTQSGGPFAVYSPFARAAFAAGAPKQPSPSPRRIRPVRTSAGFGPAGRLEAAASGSRLGRRLARHMDPRRGRSPHPAGCLPDEPAVPIRRAA